MNVTRTDSDALNARLTIEIDKSDYEPEVAKSLKTYAKRVNLRGFRPGHAPLPMVKKMYGGQAFMDAVNELVGKTLTDYIKDNKLDLLGEPLPADDQEKIDVEAQPDTLTFKFDLGLAPEPTASVEGLKVAAYEPVAQEADIDEEIKTLCHRHGAQVEVETSSEKSLITGIVKCGDQVNPKGVMGVALVKDEAQKALFVGRKLGDVVTFDMRKAFVEDREIGFLLGFGKDEASLAAITEGLNSTIEITKISEFQEAVNNAELWQKAFPAEKPADEPAFRALVKASIEKTNASMESYRFAMNVRGTLLAQAGDFKLPEEFLKRWITYVNKDNDKATPEVIDKEFPAFLNDMRWRLVRNKIGRDNDLKVTAEDVIEHAKSVARTQFIKFGMPNFDEEQLYDYTQQLLKDEEHRQQMQEGALDDKIVALVREKGAVQVEQCSLEEFRNKFTTK